MRSRNILVSLLGTAALALAHQAFLAEEGTPVQQKHPGMTDRCQYLIEKSKFFDLRALNTADDGKTPYFTIPAKD
jgi:hypothetical protein